MNIGRWQLQIFQQKKYFLAEGVVAVDENLGEPVNASAADIMNEFIDMFENDVLDNV